MSLAYLFMELILCRKWKTIYVCLPLIELKLSIKQDTPKGRTNLLYVPWFKLRFFSSVLSMSREKQMFNLFELV